MIPRSSRSHSIAVPADSITASVPQVACPPTRNATMGKVPAAPRPITVGACWGPVHWSSIPPVPKVALARPGSVQPWPTSEACWSPAIPQIGGAPGSAVAAPTGPDESTTAGIIGRGIRSFWSSASSQSMERSTSAVTAALVASVTWSASAPAAAPPERVQATQLSTVPKQSSPCSARVRSGSTSSRMAMTLVAEALGASRIPSACNTRHVPTVRRSCQPMPGATGFPVARSHTMLEARWFAMPTPATGPPSSSAARATSRMASAIRAASNSTSPGAGVSGRKGTRCSCSTVASGRTIAARTPEVPTSTTRMLPPAPLMPRVPVRTARPGRTCPG